MIHMQQTFLIAKQCIPNKIVTIKPSDSPWLKTKVKQFIVKRKRVYKKHFSKQIHQLTVSSLKHSKHCNMINDQRIKTKTNSQDREQTEIRFVNVSKLVSFISPTSKPVLPSLELNGSIYTEQQEKANLLNTFFSDQTRMLSFQTSHLMLLCHILQI